MVRSSLPSAGTTLPPPARRSFRVRSIILSLVVFFIWVFPGNQATANWTEMPDNWEALRRQWEYGHAANAVIVFAALLATGRALIGSGEGP